MDTTFKMNPAVKATVKVNSKIRFGFRINGGGSPIPPEPPEPDPGVAVITGSPVVRMSGIILPISGTIYGTAEEVE